MTFSKLAELVLANPGTTLIVVIAAIAAVAWAISRRSGTGIEIN